VGETIVIFGGTFDPVHNGHLITARSIAEQLGFEKVLLMPAASPPHKPAALAEAQARLEMLRLATQGDALFELSDLELRRVGPSYTLETVRQLRARHGKQTQIKLIVGADMLEELPSWHRVDELLAEAQIITAMRPPWDRRMDEVFKLLRDRLGTQTAEQLRRAVLRTPLIAISSSEIRLRVRQGKSIRYLVPDAVERYIVSNSIYVR